MQRAFLININMEGGGQLPFFPFGTRYRVESVMRKCDQAIRCFDIFLITYNFLFHIFSDQIDQSFN